MEVRGVDQGYGGHKDLWVSLHLDQPVCYQMEHPYFTFYLVGDPGSNLAFSRGVYPVSPEI